MDDETRVRGRAFDHITVGSLFSLIWKILAAFLLVDLCLAVPAFIIGSIIEALIRSH
jgi:hypothetical protein